MAYPIVVTPDALVERGVPKNPGLTTRISSHVFFIEGQESYAHTSVPRRRRKGLPGLNPDKAHLRSHPDHKGEIISYIAAVMTKGLPQHGKERSHGQEEVALIKLARAVGLEAASSICRHLRRSKLVKRLKRAYSPSRFESSVPEGSDPLLAKYYRIPTLKQLKQLTMAVKFRQDAAGRHYYHSPAWLRDSRSRIPKSPLVVMEYLCSRGLLQMRYGRMIYEMPISLRQISRATSMHPETVRRALSYWEGKSVYSKKQKLGAEVLRFVRGKREKYIRPDNTIGYRRKPSKIVYVAENKFTLQMAEEELARFITAAGKMRGHDPMWRARAEDIYLPLVRSWVGTERHIQTLQAEGQKRMIERGIPKEVIADLFESHDPP